MMKRITSLIAAAIVAVGLSPAVGQEGEDYTSHLANPSFTEGYSTEVGDTICTLYLCSNGYLVAPAGWKMTYLTSVWDQQYVSYSSFTDDLANGGVGSSDDFRHPLLEPQDGDDGFYFHAITGGGLAPDGTVYSLLQTVNTLPSGRYVLSYYGALKDRANVSGGVELSEAAVVVSTPLSTSQSLLAVFDSDTNPEWTEGQISFSLTEDNQSVTLGLQFDLLGINEQQLYLDNITLRRTGDVTMEDLINETLAGVDNAILELTNKYMGMDETIIPDAWIDPLDDVMMGVDIDTISSITGGEYYLSFVQAWSARLDSLVDMRSELQVLSDSMELLIEEATYDGIEAIQTLQENAGELLASNPDLVTLDAAITGAEDAIFDYLRSGLVNGATYDEPSNVTSFFIINPGVDGTVAQTNPEGWTVTSNSGQPWVYSGDRYYTDGTTNTGTYFNTWDGTAGNVEFTATQVITSMPMGIYKLQALMANDGTGGCYLFAKVGDTYYYTMAPTTSTTLDTVVVDNILVLQDGDSMTIGITCQAEDLWSGAVEFDGYIMSGDDFELWYEGGDLTVLKDVLQEAIDELSAVLEAGTYDSALKGDVAVTESVLASAQSVVDNEEVSSYGTALVEVNAQTGLLDASVSAATEIVALCDSANLLIASSAEKMGSALEALEEEVEFANTWVVSEDAITDDADAVIESLTKALTAANDSINMYDRMNIEPGDVTYTLLVNPDCDEGTSGEPESEGYIFETTGSAYLVWASEDDAFLAEPHGHLCFWSGRLPADSVGFNVYQIVGNVPSGYYRMTAMAVVGAAGETAPDTTFSNGNVVFYAVGDVNHEVQVPLRHACYENGDTLTTSSTGEDSLKLYCNEVYPYTLDNILVNHGEFKFGMKTIGPMNVTTARIYGFTLEYLSAVDYEPYPDAIQEVGVDAATLKAYAKNGYIIVETDEPYEVYSVSGGAAMNPDMQFVPGVYIVKAGSKTVKVLVD